MRILFVNGLEALSQRAFAINSIKMAEGFAAMGHDVTIVCRQSKNGKVSPENMADVYGLTKPLRWVQLPLHFLHYPVDQHWLFTLGALPTALRINPDLVFARNYIFPYLSSKIGFQTVAETHAHVGFDSSRFLTLLRGTTNKKFKLLITISRKLSSYYESLGVPSEKLLVLPDAVDLDLFLSPPQKPPSPFPSGKPIAVYAGHLYDYKGIPTIIEAAELLPDIDFHFVGGMPEDVERQKVKIKEHKVNNIVLHGMKKHSEVPPYLWHADVLLLPLSAKHPSAEWTSPVKLGEYLASGTPVVASDIVALRDVLTDEDVHFVSPDDGSVLAKGILKVLDNAEYAQSLGKQGLTKAKSLSYQNRAMTILEKLGS
jgi:glycosyltransferase involved in cell wall biosynthesis